MRLPFLRCGGFLAPRNVEVAPARRAAADEHRVPAFLYQPLEAVDARAAAELDAEIENVAHFLVDHFERQAEARNLRPDHAARARVAIEDRNLVAKRREIARDGERRGARAHARDALAVAGLRFLREPCADVVLVVGGDALQPANRDRLGFLAVVLLDAAAPARRLARAVAGATEDAREHVRFPVDHVGVAVAARGDQPDVFGNGSMGGARPLTIYDLMEVVGMLDVSRLQLVSLLRPFSFFTAQLRGDKYNA